MKKVLNWQWSSEANSSGKCNSVSEATSLRRFCISHSERGLRKFNRFFYKNCCLNLRLLKKNILQPSFVLNSGCYSKVKANIHPKFVLVPLLQRSCERYWLTTVRPYGDLIVLSKFREGVLYLGRPASSNSLAPYEGRNCLKEIRYKRTSLQVLYK